MKGEMNSQNKTKTTTECSTMTISVERCGESSSYTFLAPLRLTMKIIMVFTSSGTPWNLNGVTFDLELLKSGFGNEMVVVRQ